MGEAKQPLLQHLESRNIPIIKGDIDKDQYYSIKEVAQILKCSPATVRKKIESQEIPSVWYEIGAGMSRYLVPKEAINKPVIVQEVMQINKPVDMGMLDKRIGTLLQESNIPLHEELIAVRQELAEIKEMLKNGHKKEGSQLSFIGKLKSLFG